MTAVYDRHSYDLEKRAALDFWGERVEAIIANKRDLKVLTFRPRMQSEYPTCSRRVAQ